MHESLDSDSYKKFLSEKRNYSYYLHEYPGNSGDMLIRLGTEILMSRLQLKQVMTLNQANICIMPGGNPAMWDGHIEIYKNLFKKFPDIRFIEGPATFSHATTDWKEVFARNKKNILALFARDEQSYHELLKENLDDSACVGLAHDPAFHIFDSKWLKELKGRSTNEYNLMAFRNDKEAFLNFKNSTSGFLDMWPFRRLFGLSQFLRAEFNRKRIAQTLMGKNKRSISVDVSLLPFESFVQIINDAAEVHTDRLHCLILSVLLGKKCYAYPTNYNKLRSVCDKSKDFCFAVQHVVYDNSIYSRKPKWALLSTSN